jgi:hypothetical protein
MYRATLYANNNRVIKSRKMNCAGDVACMRVMRNILAHLILIGKPEGMSPFRNL